MSAAPEAAASRQLAEVSVKRVQVVLVPLQIHVRIEQQPVHGARDCVARKEHWQSAHISQNSVADNRTRHWRYNAHGFTAVAHTAGPLGA